MLVKWIVSLALVSFQAYYIISLLFYLTIFIQFAYYIIVELFFIDGVREISMHNAPDNLG